VSASRWIAVALGCALLLAGGALYQSVLAHGYSARARPWRAEEWIARRVRRLATGADARDLVNPLRADPIALAEARDHFADHCSICHANDGSGRTELNRGLYPPAPDLRGESTQALRDGELFRIVRDGIRFTGMPGFGGEDEQNWQLVLFLRHLPELTDEELGFMRVPSRAADRDAAAGAFVRSAVKSWRAPRGTTIA
jgi:mono/diheme cytochrome c family protein